MQIIAVICRLAAFVAAPIANAQETDNRYDFRIDTVPLSQAIKALHDATGTPLWVDHDLALASDVNPVAGRHTLIDALGIMLEGTGLTSSLTESGMIVITRDNGAKTPHREEDMASGKLKKGLMASVAAFVFGASAGAQQAETIDERDAAQNKSDEIIVTGTNIRGVGDQFSPVTTFTRDDFDLAGFGSTSDFAESLLQNFGGGVAADRTMLNSGNGVGSQAINLRGIDAEATLVLLNGRRLGASGRQGDFVDVSAIPTSAIERVEVLTDGASAIYGSDAIAGVVNFILRDDYDGAETRVRFGTITDGDGDERQVVQTLGKSFDRGNILATYEFTSTDALLAVDKGFGAGNLDSTELLPDTVRHSVFATGGYDITDRISFEADGYFTARESNQASTNTVLERSIETTNAEQYGVSAQLELQLRQDWLASINAAYGAVDFETSSTSLETPPSSGLDEMTKSDVLTIDAQLQGSLFDLGGGPVKGVLGAQYREESFDNISISKITGAALSEADNERDVVAIYGELYVPIIGADRKLPAIHSLSASLAGRYTDFSDAGNSFDPKFGLAWAPTAGLTFRGTYGTSFRAPRLNQIRDRITSVQLFDYIDPDVPAGESVGIRITGETSDLDPETSTTWTAGFDYQPKFLDAFQLRATYYEIDYEGRIGAPGVDFDFATFRLFGFEEVVDRTPPSVAELQGFVDAAPFGLFNLTTFPGRSNSTLSDVEIFLDQRNRNTAATKVSGVDISAGYSLDSAAGDFFFGLDASYIDKFEEQVSSIQPVVSRVDFIFEPADLRLRGQASWRRDNLTVSAFVNYVDDYADDQTTTGPRKVASWTTADLSIQYVFDDVDTPFLKGLKVNLNSTNLFDQDPPELATTGVAVTGIRLIAFDPANANPFGRRVSVQLTRSW